MQGKRRMLLQIAKACSQYPCAPQACAAEENEITSGSTCCFCILPMHGVYSFLQSRLNSTNKHIASKAHAMQCAQHLSCRTRTGNSARNRRHRPRLWQCNFIPSGGACPSRSSVLYIKMGVSHGQLRHSELAYGRLAFMSCSRFSKATMCCQRLPCSAAQALSNGLL